MTLGDQAAAWIDDNLSAIGEGSLVNCLTSLALGAESQGLISAELIGREAIVKLAHIELFGDLTLLKAKFLVDFAGALARHVCSNKTHGGLAKCRLGISGHVYRQDLHGLVLKTMLKHEFLGANDRTGSSIGGRAALKFGEWFMNLGAILDLLEGVSISELAVRIVHTMKMVLVRHLGEMIFICAILFHMLSASVTK